MRTAVAISLSLLVSFNAFGIGAKLGSPEIGHRAGISEAQEKRVSAVLAFMNSDLKFIEGNFINQFSYQRFGGTAEKVVKFIALLEAARIWEIHVDFRDFEEQESAFSFHQDSSDRLQVIVNSGRADFSLRDFQKYLSKVVLPNTEAENSEE